MIDTSNPIEELALRLFKLSPHAPAEPFDRDVWDQFVESGLDRVMCLDGENSLHDTILVLAAAGRAAVQIPVAETILARWAAHIAGWDDDDGITILLTHEAEWRAVPWGRVADRVYTIADKQLSSYSNGFTVSSQGENLAGEPRDALVSQAAPSKQITTSIDETELLARLALFRAAMMAGAMSEVQRICVEYAGQREQFGKPIIQFQAIQQMLAVMATNAAAAQAAVQFAASEGTILGAAIAKSRVGEAVAVVCDAAHQITGAMGFTCEFPLHRLTRRLWAWRDEAGNEKFWNRFVGQYLTDTHGESLWSIVTTLGRSSGSYAKLF